MLLNACIGLVILSGLVGAFNSMISMEPWEMKFVETTADSVNRRRRRNAASSVIAMAWRMRNARREMRLTAAKLGLPSADADGAQVDSSRDEAALGTLAPSVSRFRTTAKSTFVFTSPARRKPAPAPPPPPPRADALPARLNLTRYQWLALFVDLQQQRAQYELMKRRLVLKMDECSNYRKLVKDAAQRAPSVDFLRLRLMRIRHQCSLIADKLMGSQRPQTYQSNPIVSAMVKLFKGDIASKVWTQC